MTDPLTIRPLAREDLSALKAVIDANDLFPSALLDDMVNGYLTGAAPDDAWWTAELGGTPIAVAYHVPERMTDGTWNLLLIAVHPSWHGKGVGAALMQHVETVLAARAARILLVETSGLPAFERTRAFYRYIGYDEEARIRDFYAAGEDKVVFRKALGSSA